MVSSSARRRSDVTVSPLAGLVSVRRVTGTMGYTLFSCWLLILFAVVVGAGTAISPCVLPVLPAMLSASGSGGRRRPLGIVIGLTTTFAITIVGIAKVVGGVGLGVRSAARHRDRACSACSAACALLVPRRRPCSSSARSPRFSRLGPRSRGDGFRSGLLVGARARLRLHAVRRTDPRRRDLGRAPHSGRAVAVGLAYALGTGPDAARARARRAAGARSPAWRAGRALAVQRALGAIMLLTAVALATIARREARRVDRAEHPERQRSRRSLDNSDGRPSRGSPDVRTHRSSSSRVAPSAARSPARARDLADLGAAPAFAGTEDLFQHTGRSPAHAPGAAGNTSC